MGENFSFFVTTHLFRNLDTPVFSSSATVTTTIGTAVCHGAQKTSTKDPIEYVAAAVGDSNCTTKKKLGHVHGTTKSGHLTRSNVLG